MSEDCEGFADKSVKFDVHVGVQEGVEVLLPIQKYY